MPAGSGDTFAPVKRVLILGSTGSIGVQALDVIDDAADMTCVGLACGTRVDDMRAQADARGIPLTCAAVGRGSIAHSQDLGNLIDAAEPDIVVNALVGAAGLPPTLAALERGIAVALANKESLVAGGDLVAAARAHRRRADPGGQRALRALPVAGGSDALPRALGDPHGIRRAVPRQEPVRSRGCHPI